jgi:hypothetical protein
MQQMNTAPKRENNALRRENQNKQPDEITKTNEKNIKYMWKSHLFN